MKRILTLLVAIFAIQGTAWCGPLHVAALRGDFQAVRQAIAQGCDVNERLSVSARPLFEMFDKAYASSLSKDSNNPTWMKYTPLLFAAQRGHEAVVKLLLEKGADPNVRKGNGATPLIMASQEGHANVVKLLIDHGADVNAKWRNGATALFQAAREGHTDVVRVLVDNGANVQAKRDDGSTPLSVAKQKKHASVIALLAKSNKPVNKNDIVRQIKKETNNSNFAMGINDTPLHYALKQELATDIIKVLIDSGEDVNGVDDIGQTPLHIALQIPNIEAVKLLLKHGADINRKTDYGFTPLHYAAENAKDIESVTFLLTHGAAKDINTQTNDKVTPLHSAARQPKLEIVRLLVDYGADKNINAIAKYGETPLYYAVRMSSLDAVKYLLERGAGKNINTKTALGWTVLHNALFRGVDDQNPDAAFIRPTDPAYVKLISLLLENGADKDINARTNKGFTPLHYALEAQNHDVINLLRAYGAK